MEDLSIINNKVIINSYDNSISLFTFSYFLYYIMLRISVYYINYNYLRTLFYIISLMQLIMLLELLSIKNNNYIYTLVMLVIIIDLYYFMRSNRSYINGKRNIITSN